MWFIYSIGLVLILCFIFYSHRAVKLKTLSKFKDLISCLLQFDKNLKLEYENTDMLLLFSISNNGTINIYLVEYNGILYVTIELINDQNHFEKKEWVFMNEMNQFFMFEEILTAYLKENPSSFFHQKKILRLLDKNIEQTKKIPFVNIFTKENLTQASFCLAFNSIKLLSREAPINSKSNFEILLFNCIVSFQKIKFINTNFQWHEYLQMLIHYLESKSLINQIKDIDLFLNHRFAIYSEEIERIKNNSKPNYSTLYYYFFEKPFTTKPKIKMQVSNKTDFAKSLAVTIAAIEEKIIRLELLSK